MAAHEVFLKNILSKYRYADIAKRDVLNVLDQFKDLRPSVDGFIFKDGQRVDLLNLEGTIPVNYKGNLYHTPICVWLLDTHPYFPPMVYVKPTSTMQIRQGRYVDANGKIDLPYLRDWRYPQSDLFGLIHILVIVFSEEPPVFSRTQAPPYPSHVSSYPPYPSSGGGYPMPTTEVAGGGVNLPYPPSYFAGGGITGYPQEYGGYTKPGYIQQGGYAGYIQQGGYWGYPLHSGHAGSPSSTNSSSNSSGYPQHSGYARSPSSTNSNSKFSGYTPQSGYAGSTPSTISNSNSSGHPPHSGNNGSPSSTNSNSNYSRPSRQTPHPYDDT